jgi:membrane carboxypeptidase/penicillin-binding protein
VADEPLQVDVDGRVWTPENFDRRFRGVIDLRTTLADSRNVPTVRVARHCGFAATARRFRAAGLSLPNDPPPSFVLGAVEVSPLELAAAYTVLAAGGRRLEPRPLVRVERPGGRTLSRAGSDAKRVARASSAWLVRSMMGSAVAEGTAEVGAIAGFDVAAKTGSSSDLRDGWFAGHAGRFVTVVWVGLDEGRLGLTGSVAAGPPWHRFMAQAVPQYSAPEHRPPAGVFDAWIDSRTGLLVRERNRHAHLEWFRRGAQPRRDRFWRLDDPVPVVR